MTKQANQGGALLPSILALSLFISAGEGFAASLTIKEAKWESGDKKLVVKGLGPRDALVTVSNAGDGNVIGSKQSKDEGDGEWRVRVRRGIETPPCRVRAEANGQIAERRVKNAGSNCDDGAPPTNTAPVAVNDTATTEKDTAVIVNVLGNDTDADGDPLSISAVTQANGGSVSITGSQINYTPAAGFEGNDSFGYTVDDTNGGSDSATVMVTVQGTEPPPSIMGDSINSTSAGTASAEPMVPEQPFINTGDYALLAANDLGMHCADLDYQIFSILPPFNVVHAQLIRRGSEPDILDDSNIDMVYSAASSANDPAAANHTAAERGEPVFKSNFWEQIDGDSNPLWYEVYSPLYFGLLKETDLVQDKGLPVPDSMKLAGSGEPYCLEDYLSGAEGADGPRGQCDLAQAWMPAWDPALDLLKPYEANEPQHFDRFDRDFNFFNGLLGGLGLGAVIPETNWFSAEGVAMLPVDDLGRSNAYPLMRIQAIVKDSDPKDSNNILASTDVVLPVASEADCQQCHARTMDCEAITQEVYGYEMAGCTEEALDRTDLTALGGVMTLEGEQDGAGEALPPGDTLEQRLLNTAKINILRTHDAKHGTSLDSQRRVVCASCHYSPALDLAQLGPTDSDNTEQTRHISMSRAMHGHHGELLSKDGGELFPDMPAPGNRTAQQTQDILQDTCYACHPGKRTQCLRGAMANAGIVCQDCHGGMLAVGDDFSAGLSATPYPVGADFDKRVPWASEPGCQSCHVGDAVDQPADTTNFIYADDGIRLLQAYAAGDANATPIEAPESRFAENESLYRLSKGHGGVMCEGCHGSTHAIWPNANPWANDNVTATQVQGHRGTITECSVCHEGSLGLTLDGPHGMHPVASTKWNKDHKEKMGDGNNSACKSCHGKDGKGTVLSRTAAERNWECKNEEGTLCGDGDDRVTVAKGTTVTCDQCHENEINHN